MAYDDDKQFQRNDVFSKRIRAGKRRTYFFDVRTTKANDYYLTITESKKRFNDDGYDRHKVFVYKEDFNKFITTLEEVVDHIKNELMPEYDFDTFTREPEDITYDGTESEYKNEEVPGPAANNDSAYTASIDETSGLTVEKTIAEEVINDETLAANDTTKPNLNGEDQEVIKWD